MKQETVFAKGLWAKRGEGAPDYVICTHTYKVDEFIEFLKEHKDSEGYTRVDTLLGKDGKKMYGKLNTFKKTSGKGTSAKHTSKDDDGDVPF
jgi:hypothetical protein